ncbi:MAG: hypothetical protein RL334_1500 [Chloroflexota bacterium]
MGANQKLPETIKHVAPVWSRGAALLAERGEGAYLYTSDGRQWLDFTCGIGVTNTGHSHPAVVAAIQAQAGRLLHAQANIVYHQPMLDLIEQLLTIVPAPLDQFFFSNSGAEISEAAVKLARQATRRPNIIVFQGSFHGRTNLTIVFVTPYPYSYRYGWDDEATTQFCLRELHHLLRTQTAPDETAAIIIEPVLGEGGYVAPPRAFVEALRAICDEHCILFIADEVQSGFGRTGRWFGIDHFGVVPDIMIMAKGIASGLPLSALAASTQLMARWTPGSHGGTYGGNAVACAAGAATVRAMRTERMIENAAAMGQVLQTGLRRLQEEHPCIGDVRGLGLMVGTEFTTAQREPHTAAAKAVVKQAFEHGLLLLTCGTYDNVVRWIPPLIVSEAQIKHALEIFETSLQETAVA